MIKRFIARLEKIFSRSRFLTGIYASLYKQIVKREIVVANITKKDIVLHIGCGSIPYTSLHIARLTGARVVAIDSDVKAVRSAQRVVRKRKLSSQIQVFHWNGVSPFKREFTLAFLSLQAEPKAEIIKALRERMDPLRVVARLAAKRFAGFYDSLPEGLDIKRSVAHPAKAFDRSVYIEE